MIDGNAKDLLRSALFLTLVAAAWAVALHFGEAEPQANRYGDCLEYSRIRAPEFVPGCSIDGISFNSAGLQDEEHAPKAAAGVQRVLILGHGLDTPGTDNAHIAAEYLRQKLRALGENGYEIINGSRIFTDASREADFALDLIERFHPGKILYFQMNDFVQHNFSEAAHLQWDEDGHIRAAEPLPKFRPAPQGLSWFWPGRYTQRAWYHGADSFQLFTALRRRAGTKMEEEQLFVQPTIAAVKRLQARLKAPGDLTVIMPARPASNFSAVPNTFPLLHSVLQPFVPPIFIQGERVKKYFEEQGLNVTLYPAVPEGEFTSGYLNLRQGAYLTSRGHELFADAAAGVLRAPH